MKNRKRKRESGKEVGNGISSRVYAHDIWTALCVLTVRIAMLSPSFTLSTWVPTHLHLRQILLIQPMHFPGQIRPIQTLRQHLPQLPYIPTRSFHRKFNLPPAQIVQQPQVRLNEHAQTSRAHEKIGVDEWNAEVLHYVGDLWVQCVFEMSNDWWDLNRRKGTYRVEESVRFMNCQLKGFLVMHESRTPRTRT